MMSFRDDTHRTRFFELPDDPEPLAVEELEPLGAPQEEPLTASELTWFLFLASVFVALCAFVAWLASGMTLSGLWAAMKACAGQ